MDTIAIIEVHKEYSNARTRNERNKDPIFKYVMGTRFDDIRQNMSQLHRRQ